jgi:hypothetical protein
MLRRCVYAVTSPSVSCEHGNGESGVLRQGIGECW